MLTGQVELKELLSISEIAAAAEMAHEAELRRSTNLVRGRGRRATRPPTSFTAKEKATAEVTTAALLYVGFFAGINTKTCVTL